MPNSETPRERVYIGTNGDMFHESMPCAPHPPRLVDLATAAEEYEPCSICCGAATAQRAAELTGEADAPDAADDDDTPPIEGVYADASAEEKRQGMLASIRSLLGARRREEADD